MVPPCCYSLDRVVLPAADMPEPPARQQGVPVAGYWQPLHRLAPGASGRLRTAPPTGRRGRAASARNSSFRAGATAPPIPATSVGKDETMAARCGAGDGRGALPELPAELRVTFERLAAAVASVQPVLPPIAPLAAAVLVLPPVRCGERHRLDACAQVG